jgi:hypothetical protein
MQRYQEEVDFVQWIVIDDEMWVHHYESDSKLKHGVESHAIPQDKEIPK